MCFGVCGVAVAACWHACQAQAAGMHVRHRPLAWWLAGARADRGGWQAQQAGLLQQLAAHLTSLYQATSVLMLMNSMSQLNSTTHSLIWLRYSRMPCSSGEGGAAAAAAAPPAPDEPPAGRQ
jgi:hypothetical protein